MTFPKKKKTAENVLFRKSLMRQPLIKATECQWPLLLPTQEGTCRTVFRAPSYWYVIYFIKSVFKASLRNLFKVNRHISRSKFIIRWEEANACVLVLVCACVWGCMLSLEEKLTRLKTADGHIGRGGICPCDLSAIAQWL